MAECQQRRWGPNRDSVMWHVGLLQRAQMSWSLWSSLQYVCFRPEQSSFTITRRPRSEQSCTRRRYQRGVVVYSRRSSSDSGRTFQRLVAEKSDKCTDLRRKSRLYSVRYDTIRDAISTCAWKPTRVSLIYRTYRLQCIVQFTLPNPTRRDKNSFVASRRAVWIGYDKTAYDSVSEHLAKYTDLVHERCNRDVIDSRLIGETLE